ncbi:MAG: LLM class flavin-dependent oxidoreductase [Deltaproteobacteria bacterium]|nr:LLM class flavin-dependent oxidoreductase [Deltaproteobacteria bacterium]MBW2363374.1 LLM class flavin-dependent oxidoreductase [Deltaproteobacteria bacterium]
MAFSVMRFDLRAPAFSPAAHADLYPAALDIARYADENGWDAAVVCEHHAVDDGFLPSPIPMLAALAGRTRELRLTASALLLPLYDPVKLAEDLAVLDLVSGGRCRLTVGMGYRPDEYAMFGKGWDTRGKLMDECLEVLCRAWLGEPFDWNGRRVHMTTRPITLPKPPIMCGGTLKVGARRAARFGLPFAPSVNTPAVIEEYLVECERLGVADPVVLAPGSGEWIWCSNDPDRTWAQIGKYLLHDVLSYASWQRPGEESAVYSPARDIDELRAEGRYRILTPDECVARAKELGEKADFAHFPLCGGTPPDLAWESIELFTNEVIPRIS